MRNDEEAKNTDKASVTEDLARLHFRVGWWALLVFVAFGLMLETLHGFKVGYYLDAENSSRRLMWTLAHAHGTLFSILNIVFALSLPGLSFAREATRSAASRCFLGALFLLPAGFLLGGVIVHGGDPSLGVLLVPPGALLLGVALFLTARAVDI